MSAEEDGRSDDNRERRGDNGRRQSSAGRGSGARGGPGGPRDRKDGGPREGARGRPTGGGWKGKDRDPRGSRDARKPGRPFKRPDDRRGGPREGRSDGPKDRRFSGPRDDRRENRSEGARGGQGGERREGRFPASRGPRPGRGGAPGRDGRPGARQSGGGQGERRPPFREPRGGRDDRRPGGRPFEKGREGRPGDRDRPFKGRQTDRDRPTGGRGGPRKPQDGGKRPFGPRRDRDDRRARFDERERPAPVHDDPLLPDDVTGDELDAEARAELRTLPKELAAKVARHLVMAGQLAEEEPERAYKHARAARRLASRVGIVREAAGIAAYHAGEWAEALAELRAARRLSTGDDSYLPLMVDCERGLGRPERALDLIKSPEAKNLDPMGRVELRIVESGVRRDLGQHDAAVVTLQIPELRDRRLRPWSARLFYAYADALTAAGRADEASDWFARAAAADRDGETDAAERYAELEGLHILDTEDGEEAEEAEEADRAQPEAAHGTTETGAPADEAAPQDDAPSEEPAAPANAPATGIEFKAAPTGEPEAPGDDAPDVPAVFLEPRPADEEQPPSTE